MIFQAGGGLPIHSYVEREADRKIFRAAMNGEHVHLFASRQSGKTALLQHLAEKLKTNGWRCAYIDTSPLKDFSKVEWYDLLGKDIARQLTPGHTPKLLNQIDLRNYLLHEALPLEGAVPRILLILDEIEAVAVPCDEWDKPLSDTFFMMLRSCYIQQNDYEGTLIVAYAGALPPESYIKDPTISPFNIGQQIVLDDFTEAETRTLTDHLSELSATIKADVPTSIYAWTNGHAYLTQRICVELEKRIQAEKSQDIAASHVEQAVYGLFLNPSNPAIRDSNLSHVGNRVDELSQRAAGIWQRLHAGETIPSSSVLPEVYQDLDLMGAVKTHQGHLIIRNRIYAAVFQPKRIAIMNTSSLWTQLDNDRIKDLADNVKAAQRRLSRHEKALLGERNPDTQINYEDKIANIKAEIEVYKREASQLEQKLNAYQQTQPAVADSQLAQVSSELRNIHNTLDSISAGQITIQKSIGEVRNTILARFDIGEQKILITILDRLDQTQIETTQAVIAAVEHSQVPEADLQNALTEIQQALRQIKANPELLRDPTLVQQIAPVSELVDDPSLEVSHKLKVTIPIIPLLLEYETEIDLKNGLNLKSAWERMKAWTGGNRAF